MRDCFWQDVRKGHFVVVEGDLSVETLVTAKVGQMAAKIFAKRKTVPVVEALKILQQDAGRRSLSGDRRRVAEKIFSRLVRALADAIDDSAGKTVWTANRVESLDQLRTARGYRKASHGCQEAVLQAGSEAGPSIAAALQAQSHFASSATGEQQGKRNKDRPGKFLEAERLSYVAAGRQTFAATRVLSVVADAVHVGQEDWLNVFLCDTEQDLSFVCPQQVKKGTAITSEAWTDMWQGRLTSFFQKVGTKGRSADKATGGVRQPERQATQEWLRDLSHSLAVVGWSWSCCRRTTDEARPFVLVLCTDQEATQLAAANYLSFGRQLFVQHVPDPAHRSHNDVHLAMAAAGLLTFSIVSIGLYNVRYGPWNKGTWFGKVQTMADEMSRSMSPSDPLLLAFFPEILADQGRSQDENTEESRRAFLESLPNRSFVRSKGSKASQSRFNSLSTAHAELDRDWSAFCLVLVVICVAEGWAKSAADLWTPQSEVAESAGSSRAAAKSAARKALQKQRGRSVNTLHGMTMFACNPDNKSLARTVFFVLGPEGIRCSKMLEDLRSAEATVKQYSEWAHWEYMTVAHEHVAKLSNLAALQRIGLDMSMLLPEEEAREAAVTWQDAVARRVVRLTQRLLRYRCGSQLPSTNGWGSTAGLLHQSTEARRASLSFLADVDKTVQAVQKEGSLEAKQLLEGHPATGPVMALVLSELRAGSFVEVAADTLAFLRRLWSGLLNSKLVEDANKVQREAEQRNGTSKTIGRLEGWHGLTRKKLLEGYKRPEVGCGAMSVVPTKFEADQWFQRPKRLRMADSLASASTASTVEEVSDQSLEEDVLKGVSLAKTWASHTPESEQDRLASFSLLTKVVKEGKDWTFVEQGWWASFAPEGHGLLFPGLPPCYVVRSYKRAALVWPAKLEKVAESEEMLVLDPEAPSLCWLHLYNDEVVVLDLVATSPQRGLRLLGETRPLGVALRVQAKRPLLRHHEVYGFAGVAEWGLRRLVQSKGWSLEASEEAGHEEDDRLAVACLLSLEATLTKDEVVARILFRQEAATWASECGELDLAEVVRDTMLSADQEVALQQIAKRKATHQTAVQVRQRVSKTFDYVAKKFASRPEFKKAAAARKAKEKKAEQHKKEQAAEIKRCYALVSSDVDKAVKAAVPAAVRVYTDPPNGRWKLSYSTAWAYATRSISWTAIGSKAGGAEVLRQAWSWAETFDGLDITDEAAAMLQKLGQIEHDFQLLELRTHEARGLARLVVLFLKRFFALVAMGRATLAETGGVRPASAYALFCSWVAREGLSSDRAARFRIRGKRMVRNGPAIQKKWRHKKSKDLRDHFTAQAKKAYEDNRAKAEAFRTAQSRELLPSEPLADEEAVAVELEADRARTELFNDSWTWTLGVAVRDLTEVSSGVSGRVFVGSFAGQPVALKVALGRGLRDPMQRAAAGGLDVAEEFAILGALGQHPNVVRAFGVLTSSLGKTALLLERATESLHDTACRLQADRLETSPAGKGSLLQLFQQFLLGLSFVHGRSILHLDVKPRNILVFDGVRAALADFGHSESASDGCCSVVGDRVYTEAFRCSECLMAGDRKVRVTFAGDVWAAAVSLFEICSPAKASLWTVSPKTFVRETEEQTAQAIREMAIAKSAKVMPFNQNMVDVLEKVFVPASRRLSLSGMLQSIQRDRRALGQARSF
ncbi:MKK5 [Symbiodinium sp. CCMP2592]|nr:MKK5 [Symbiodinium sp. CCMP2592]